MSPSARGGSGDRGGTGSACALPGQASGEGHTLFCASWVKEKPLLGAQPHRLLALNYISFANLEDATLRSFLH